MSGEDEEEEEEEDEEAIDPLSLFNISGLSNDLADG